MCLELNSYFVDVCDIFPKERNEYRVVSRSNNKSASGKRGIEGTCDWEIKRPCKGLFTYAPSFKISFVSNL